MLCILCRHGRRIPCIIIPVFGELATVFGLILCTYFKNTSIEAVGVTDSLFPGLSGNVLLFTYFHA